MARSARRAPSRPRATRPATSSLVMSQWMRFFTVLGSGTGTKSIDSNGSPGTSSIQENPRSSSTTTPPMTSAHHARLACGRRGVGRVDAPSRRAARRSVPAHEGAQLAALGVGERHPTRTPDSLGGQRDRGAQGEDGSSDARLDVEVHALLHRPRLGHGVDPDRLPRASAPGGRRRRRRAAPPRSPSSAAPEPRHAVRVGGVDAQVLPASDGHATILPAICARFRPHASCRAQTGVRCR